MDNVDPRIAKAFSHPLRGRILVELEARGVASAAELHEAFGGEFSHAALTYHIKRLHHLGILELVSNYRVRVELPAPARSALAEAVRSLTDEMTRSAIRLILSDQIEGTPPDAAVRRRSVILDRAAMEQLSAHMRRWHDRATRIEAASARRLGAQHGTKPTRSATLILLLFEELELDGG